MANPPGCQLGFSLEPVCKQGNLPLVRPDVLRLDRVLLA